MLLIIHPIILSATSFPATFGILTCHRTLLIHMGYYSVYLPLVVKKPRERTRGVSVLERTVFSFVCCWAALAAQHCVAELPVAGCLHPRHDTLAQIEAEASLIDQWSWYALDPLEDRCLEQTQAPLQVSHERL